MSDVTLTGAKYRRHSEKAVLLSWQGNELWIPLTQLRAVPHAWESAPASIARADDVIISEWIACQKGISVTKNNLGEALATVLMPALDPESVANLPSSEAVIGLLRREAAALKKERDELKKQLEASNKRANDAFMQVTALEQRMQLRDDELRTLRVRVGARSGSTAEIAAQQTAVQPKAPVQATQTEASSEGDNVCRFSLLETE